MTITPTRQHPRHIGGYLKSFTDNAWWAAVFAA